jgi:uncharacterized protein (DUF3820 family)
MSTLNFGKYKTKSIQDIYDIDHNYCRWLLNQELLIGDLPDIKEFLSFKFDSTDLSFLLTWGKHKNKTIKWIFDNDKQYFNWLAKNQYVKDKCPKLFESIQNINA